MVVDVPILKTGMNINGVVFTEESIASVLDSFYSNQEKIKCINKESQYVGGVKNLKYEDGVLIASIELNKTGYKIAKPVIQQSLSLLQIKVE